MNFNETFRKNATYDNTKMLNTDTKNQGFTLFPETAIIEKLPRGRGCYIVPQSFQTAALCCSEM